jgi:hypothetical protein
VSARHAESGTKDINPIPSTTSPAQNVSENVPPVRYSHGSLVCCALCADFYSLELK